jgi:hypothetical protein
MGIARCSVDTAYGLGSQFWGDEMSHWQEIDDQELVDSFLADQVTVADGYYVGPSRGHDGRYDGCIGSSRDDGEGSWGVGSCCLLMGMRCGL